MLCAKVVAITLIPALLGIATPSEVREPSASLPVPPSGALDLRIHGIPLQGQPLVLEVEGSPLTPFVLWIEILRPRSGSEGSPPLDPRSFIPGARAATSGAAALSGIPLPGITDARGTWSQPFRAPEEGTELRIRGVGLRHGAPPQVLEALELEILPAYSPRTGDVIVSGIQRSPDASGFARGQSIELYNGTDYDIDLEGWTLRDDESDFLVLPAGVVIPSRSHSVVAASDTFHLDDSADEIILEDERSREIDRVAYNTALGSGTSNSSTGLVVGPTWSPWSPPCVAQLNAADVPDLNYRDTNCDGIDGDIARAVFVSTSGSAANPGTMALPMNDVNAAIQVAAADPAKDQVYVSEGTYAGLVTLADGVSVWGGFSHANAWQRSSAYVTTFSSTTVLSNGVVGVRGANLSGPITLGSVRVVTANAGAILHNYGVLLHQSDAVTLEGVTVLAGDAGVGSSGGNGTSGSNGGNGAAGGTACGGLNYCGGAGGTGGFNGGAGGAGGHEDFHLNGWTGANGAGPNGGAGGPGGGWVSGGLNGGAGGAGSAGSTGSRGSNIGVVNGGFWQSNGDGMSGLDGAHGSGGGGGGGGSTDFFGFSGNGGGGGGGGGRRGLAGTRGVAGGTGFALFLSASTVSVTSCDLAAGDGGNGGNAGGGGAGGNGGNGGQGATCCSVPFGGNGGAGGRGGNGGAGAGGGGGHSYAILVDASSALSVVSTTLSTSAAGTGGTSPAGPTRYGLDGEAILVKQL